MYFVQLNQTISSLNLIYICNNIKTLKQYYKNVYRVHVMYSNKKYQVGKLVEVDCPRVGGVQ
jgi:hypothetical protein